MRKACFTEHQIIAVIKSVETGRTVKVDDFNRETLSIKIILNLPDLRMIRVLDRIAANCGYPIMLHMNNGPEFISLILAEWAEKHAVKRSYPAVSRRRTLSLNTLTGHTVHTRFLYIHDQT